MPKKLFVGSLSYDTGEDSLREHFAQAGTVETATVIYDRATGRHKGFGFVEMSTEEEAQNAVNTLNGSTLDGRAITVSEARPMQPREDRPRQQGGGNQRYGGSRY